MNIERGAFFHEIYRIQQKLGRTFRELEPHALFPLDEYFNGTLRSKEVVTQPAFPVESEVGAVEPKQLLKYPLKKAA